jgi:hypothetical protein
MPLTLEKFPAQIMAEGMSNIFIFLQFFQAYAGIATLKMA